MNERKDRILREAARCLAQNPNLSYRDLAQAIGVGRATLYRYFPSRADLIRALCLFALQRFDDELAPLRVRPMSAMEALQAVLEILIPMGERYHFLAHEKEAMRDPEIGRLYAAQLAELRQLIASTKRQGGIAPDIPDAWIARVIDTLVYTAWEAIDAGELTRADAVPLAFRTLIAGFGA